MRNDWSSHEIANPFDLPFRAVARSVMAAGMIRLSAGRESMAEATQAFCLVASDNAITAGDRRLTAGNAGSGKDVAPFAKLGLAPGAKSDKRTAADAARGGLSA